MLLRTESLKVYLFRSVCVFALHSSSSVFQLLTVFVCLSNCRSIIDFEKFHHNNGKRESDRREITSEATPSSDSCSQRAFYFSVCA